MTRQFQEYHGAAPQSAQVSGKQVPYFGGIPQNGAAVDAAIGEVQELGVKIARLHDLGLQQRVTQERERIRTEMDVEMQQAADVAWGSEESLFRKDGSVNSDRYDAIVAKYWEECDRIEPGEFKLGENAVRYAGEQEAMRNDIALGMMKFTALKTLENTRKAFSDNLELAVGREDWEAARGLVEDARGSLLNDTEAEIELLKLDQGEFLQVQRGYMEQAAAAVANPEQFAALYDDPDFRAKLSPENQLKLEQLAARMPVDVPQQRVREVKGRDGSTRLEAEPREAPRGMPRGLVGVWNKYKGIFDSVEAKEEVRGPLLTYLRGLVQHADDPAELEQAKAVCKVYGHSAEFASQVVGQLRKEIDGTAAFNAREAVKAFRGQGRYFRPKNTMMLEGMRTRFTELIGKERSDEENKEYKVLSEKIAKWEDYDKAETEKAERAIFAKFDQWILRNPNANYMQQARAFYDFCDAHSQEDSLALDVDQMAEEAAGMFERDLLAEREKRKQAGIDLRADIKVAERMREDAEEARDKAAAEEADAEAGESMVEVSLVSEVGVTNGWAGNATERILYVPKGHALAGKDVVLQTPADVEADKVKVVEHANCSAPMMSQKLRRDMGLLKNPYDTITFEGAQGRLSQGGFMATAKRARSLGGLAPYYRAFVDAARRNDLDPNLLMAIAMHETGRGTSSAFRNKKNAMGVSDRRGPVTFRSVEQSIYYMAEQLRKHYVGKGLTTIEQIGKKYAPVGAGNDPKGLNKHWVTGVARYMDELTK
ncbi:MAG: glucosaminidase domain-containing protein [Akkermansia sp.]|nr:glucosaminidase domain-containing protein [Akkermansia sp.]